MILQLLISYLCLSYAQPRGTVNNVEFDTELAPSKRATTNYTGMRVQINYVGVPV